jgi:glycosyltransferase involved in cell wall biosynthesis
MTVYRHGMNGARFPSFAAAWINRGRVRMRIIQITPGTGNFYCGSCMRDNTLVRALRGMGHDVLMAPLYLPLVTDEEAADGGAPILMGGISVYLQQKSGLFRFLPRWVDRAFASRRLLSLVSGRAGMTAPDTLGNITVSMLRGEEGRQVREIDRLADWLRGNPLPDVVCLNNALLLGLVRRIKKALGVPVVCALQGEDTFLDGLPEPFRAQAWKTATERAKDVDAFIAVSRYYWEAMTPRLGLAREKVNVVYNGMRMDGYGPSAPAGPAVGFLARMTPAKGLETLVEAFIRLRKNMKMDGVRLRIAGSRTAADEPFVRRMQARLAAEGLSADWLPNIDRAEKAAFLRTLTALSVPAAYDESFGFYVIEALASGVPVVEPRRGAFPELIEATGGGLLCAPDDPAALAEGLAALLNDAPRAREMGQRGREAVLRSFTAERMASGVMEVLEKTVGEWRGRGAP